VSELVVSTSETQSRLCQNLQDPPLGRTAWNALLKESETRSVFLTWQWLATWWECFGTGRELFTIAVLRSDQLVGIAPLMLRHEAGTRIVEFLGRGASEYCDFIASADDKAEVIAAVWDALLRRRDRWDRIELDGLPESSSTARRLGKLELPAGSVRSLHDAGTSPALSIAQSRAFAEACTRKKSLRRHTRYFERLAPLEFRHVLDSDELTDLLPEFFEQHRDRRFMAGDRSLFDDTRNRRFYERVAAQMLDSGMLRFALLRWRDENLAFHFGFLYDGVFTWYQPAFNVDFARYSPGEVMLRKLIENALESGAREFDLASGDAPFKERFANLKRRLQRVEIVQGDRLGVEPQRAPAKRADEARGEEAQNGHVFVPPPCPPPPKFGIARCRLWRTPALAPVPSEFRAQWARYSQIKALVRQEGLKPEALITALARMRRGERPVVALWQERPIALLWLARDPVQWAADLGFNFPLPAGAGLITDSYLANDVESTPRRETLMPAIQTFLAAEGFTALYGYDDPRGPEPLPERCGIPVESVARRTDVGFLVGWVRFRRRVHSPKP
jgi:CelD/BcsL family acetyltransferase involved in cellulose biosynthesis